jgi:hypothetical protein
MPGIAILAIAWLHPVGTARAQDEAKPASSREQQLKAFLRALQEAQQAFQKKQAEQNEARRLYDALQQKQADVALADAALKKCVAAIRALLEDLLPRKAPPPIVFETYRPPSKYPIIILPPSKPPRPPCPWPPPWPPPGLNLYPGVGGQQIVPFGTPGGPMGTTQSMSPMPGASADHGPDAPGPPS